jgi:hypothetical protein
MQTPVGPIERFHEIAVASIEPIVGRGQDRRVIDERRGTFTLVDDEDVRTIVGGSTSCRATPPPQAAA